MEVTPPAPEPLASRAGSTAPRPATPTHGGAAASTGRGSCRSSASTSPASPRCGSGVSTTARRRRGRALRAAHVRDHRRSITATSRTARFSTSRAAQFVFALLGASRRAARAAVVGLAPPPPSRARRRRRPTRIPRCSTAFSGATSDGSWRARTSRTRAGLVGRSRALPGAALPRPLRCRSRRSSLGVVLYALGEALAGMRPALGTSGAQLVVWGFCISTVALYHATFTINSLAHRFGARRYATRDDSRNNAWLALLTFGEGWHNNHHHFPASARQGFYWWEIDLTYYGLRAARGARHHLGPEAGAARRCATSPRSHGSRMKIAIIGSGIAGNVVAHRGCTASTTSRCSKPAATSAATRTRTRVELDGERHEIDTGFIVFNDWTYPNFIALLAELGVASQPSAMSFSVRNERSGLEYNGTSLNTLFAQRRNLLRPSFHRMIRDILRFNREAPALLDATATRSRSATISRAHGYSREFIDDYLMPMGAAIWSTDPARMLAFPGALSSCASSHNHGMLSVDDAAAVARDPRRLRALRREARRAVSRPHPPRRAGRERAPPADGVLVKARGAEAERFDHVFLACHADQALRLLARRDARSSARCSARSATSATKRCCTPTRAAAAARGAPGRRGTITCCRAHERSAVALTYNMNILQTLALARHVLRHAQSHRRDRSGARHRSASSTTIRCSRPQRVAAQQRQHEVNGVAPHVFLRRLLALRLPRRRRRQRARRARHISRARPMHSAIYSGWLRHRRFAPRAHAFRYRLFLMYLDLAELDTVFARRWLWSTRRRAARALRPRATISATRRCRSTRRCATSSRSGPACARAGPIRLLTHLRYFGYCFNPVSFYYCFDADGRDAWRRSSPRSPTRRGASATATCSSEPRRPRTARYLRYRTRQEHARLALHADGRRLRLGLQRAGRDAERAHGARTATARRSSTRRCASSARRSPARRSRRRCSRFRS